MTTKGMEERLQDLERRLNRYRTGAVLLGVAVAGLIGLAATGTKETSDEIRTHRLTVVDDQGTPAVLLHAGPYGGVVQVNNRQGLHVVAAGALQKGAEIFLTDGSPERLVELRVADASGQLELQDKKGGKHTITAASAIKTEK